MSHSASFAKPPKSPVNGSKRNLNGNGKLDAITAERSKVYGDANDSFRATGIALTGLIEAHYNIKLPHAIPPHVAGLVMVMIKAVRAARPYDYNEDTYDDMENFSRLSKQVDTRRERKE